MFKHQTSDLTQILTQVNTFEDYKNKHLNDFIDHTFISYLQALSVRSKQSHYNLINQAGLDQSYGYKIFRGQHLPSRDIIIKLALVLRLNLTETQRLLKLGQVNELYPRNERDAIIIFCLNQKKSLTETDEELYKHQQKTLS